MTTAEFSDFASILNAENNRVIDVQDHFYYERVRLMSMFHLTSACFKCLQYSEMN